MKLEIREMTIHDLDQVLAIEREVFSAPWSWASFKRELTENPYALYLAGLYQEKVVAYIGGWIVIDELHITNLAVRPEYRRQGIANKMLAELSRLARLQQVQRATLEVRESNKGAILLYRQNGFEVAGRRTGYYSDNNEDALIMWKEYKDEKE